MIILYKLYQIMSRRFAKNKNPLLQETKHTNEIAQTSQNEDILKDSMETVLLPQTFQNEDLPTETTNNTTIEILPEESFVDVNQVVLKEKKLDPTVGRLFQI